MVNSNWEFFFLKNHSGRNPVQNFDQELLGIFEAWKTWRHHLQDYKSELIFINIDNNPGQFIYTKNLSSRQVW